MPDANTPLLINHSLWLLVLFLQLGQTMALSFGQDVHAGRWNDKLPNGVKSIEEHAHMTRCAWFDLGIRAVLWDRLSPVVIWALWGLGCLAPVLGSELLTGLVISASHVSHTRPIDGGLEQYELWAALSSAGVRTPGILLDGTTTFTHMSKYWRQLCTICKHNEFPRISLRYNHVHPHVKILTSVVYHL
jgi:hypothetical protein